MIAAMVRLADRIGTLQRWRRWLFLVSIGAFATLALPPVIRALLPSARGRLRGADLLDGHMARRAVRQAAVAAR